jgi:uncharacterized coiled-coil DUF342 family protein
VDKYTGKNKKTKRTITLLTMKLEETNSTCSCDSYKNMTIKYSSMLDEYFKTNEMLRTEILKLQKEIQDLKDYIKYTL